MTKTLTRPGFIIREAIVNEDTGRTRWSPRACAHTAAGARATAERLARVAGFSDGFEVFDAATGSRIAI